MKRGGRLAPQSAKRRAESAARARVRVEVLARDGICRADLFPMVPCYQVGSRAPLEVHEVISRGRGGDYLDPLNCLALCPGSHDWVTEHPLAAQCLGLLLPSWAAAGEQATARRLWLSWAAGTPAFPDWLTPDQLQTATAQLQEDS